MKIGIRVVESRVRWIFMEQSPRTEELKENQFPDLSLKLSVSPERIAKLDIVCTHILWYGTRSAMNRRP